MRGMYSQVRSDVRAQLPEVEDEEQSDEEEEEFEVLPHWYQQVAKPPWALDAPDMDSRPMVDPTNWQHHSVQHVSDTQGVFDTNASGDLSMSSTDGALGCRWWDGSRELALLDSRATSHGEDHTTDYYERLHKLRENHVFLPPTPCWAFNEEVVEVARRCAHRRPPEPVPLGRVAGPAVRLVLASLVLQATFFFFFMPVTVVVAECSSDGYAKVPRFWYVVLVPLGLACVSLELQALRYTVVPKLQVLQHFRLIYPLSFIKVKAGFWLIQVICLSMLHIINTANIGTFTAMLIKAQACPASEMIDAIWCQVMDQSLLRFATEQLGLPKIAFAMWTLSFCHWFFAIAASVPSFGEDAHYSVCVEETPELIAKTQYRVLIGLESNHGTALFNLAEANGMVGIVDQGLHYAKKKSDLQWNANVSHRNVKCMRHASGAVVRAMQRTILAGGLKNAVQVNMQVTMLAIRRTVALYTGEPILGQHIAMASVVLGFMTIGGLLSDGRKAIAFAWEVLDVVGESQRTQEDEEMLADLTRHTYTLMFLTIGCCFFVLYAVYKLCMTFTCPTAISNLTGCVNLEGFLSNPGTASILQRDNASLHAELSLFQQMQMNFSAWAAVRHAFSEVLMSGSGCSAARSVPARNESTAR